MNWIEALAVLFGITCVVLTIRQDVWCWPAGLIQVTLYVYVFYVARLYSDMLLHIVYIALQLYGWRQWRRRTGAGVMPVSTLRGRARSLWMLAVIFTALGWGEVMDRYTDATAPHADAFIAAASLCAQYLLARKRLENWIVWIVVDVVAIAVYWPRDLKLTAGLYVVFLVLCFIGLASWYRSLHHAGDPRFEVRGTAA